MNNEGYVIFTAVVLIIGFALYYESIIYKVKNEFTRSKINYYQLENMPNTFVTIGLLGTCIGIVMGLFSFDTDASKIKDSVKDLLSGLRLAFIVTIFGLVFSLIYKRRVNNILNKYGDIQPPDSPELSEMRRTNGLMNELLIEMKGVRRAFSDELISKIQESNKKLADNLSKFGENLATSNHDALIEALQEVIEDLNTSFRDTLGQLVRQNFSELTNSIDSLNKWQQENKRYIEDFAERYKTIVGYTEDMNSNLEKIVITNANLLDQDGKLYDIIEALNTVMVEDENFVQVTSNLNTASSNIKSSLQIFTEELTETKKQLQAISELRVNIELLISKLSELNQINIDEERLYLQGIKQSMASMDEMFKRHYEAIPNYVKSVINQNGKN